MHKFGKNLPKYEVREGRGVERGRGCQIEVKGKEIVNNLNSTTEIVLLAKHVRITHQKHRFVSKNFLQIIYTNN